MSTTPSDETRRLKAEKRELLKLMRENGIKRVSCMNRLDDQTYRCNARLFAINVQLNAAQADKALSVVFS
jgi:hypothetical protein